MITDMKTSSGLKFILNNDEHLTKLEEKNNWETEA
jgi:hypothetical protein